MEKTIFDKIDAGTDLTVQDIAEISGKQQVRCFSDFSTFENYLSSVLKKSDWYPYIVKMFMGGLESASREGSNVQLKFDDGGISGYSVFGENKMSLFAKHYKEGDSQGTSEGLKMCGYIVFEIFENDTTPGGTNYVIVSGSGHGWGSFGIGYSEFQPKYRVLIGHADKI